MYDIEAIERDIDKIVQDISDLAYEVQEESRIDYPSGNKWQVEVRLGAHIMDLIRKLAK